MQALPALSREQVREVDRRAIAEYGMSGLVLMENAGRGCVDVLCEQAELHRGRSLQDGGAVAIICGKGNNAGDGFVIARHLDLRGVSVKVVLLGAPDELRGDAAANYKIIERMKLPLADLSRDYCDAAFAKEIG